MNRRSGADEKDQPKELETTGHDRFCQIRHSRYEPSELKQRKHYPLWRIVDLVLCIDLSIFGCDLFNREQRCARD